MPGYPNLRIGQPRSTPHPARGRRADWCGTWGTFADGRSAVSALARKLETALRVRFQVNGDPVLGSLAHQAARCAALSEALADSLFEGTLEAQRRTQERYVAVTRNYRKAVDLLASSSGRTPKPKSGADLVQLHRVAKAP